MFKLTSINHYESKEQLLFELIEERLEEEIRKTHY